MAWLKGFAGKAEDFLNQLDTGAAIVLNNSQNQERSPEILAERTGTSRTEFHAERNYSTASESRVDLVRENANSSGWLGTTVTPSATSRTSTQLKFVRSKEKQTDDDQLIKFLNGSTADAEGSANGSGLEGTPRSVGTSLTDWKRGPTSDSTRSFSPGGSSLPMETDGSEPWGDSSCNSGRASSASVETGGEEQGYEHIPASVGKCDNMETWKVDLVTQNQMLRQEIGSLNQETSRALARAKQAEKEMQTLRCQLETEHKTSRKQTDELLKLEKQLDETRETSFMEKENMRMLINEKNQENLLLQGQLSSVLAENQRHLSESQDVAGVQSQAILAMEERMRTSEQLTRDRESMLEEERIKFRSMEMNLTEKIKVLEAERQNNKTEISSVQKIQDGLKGMVVELQASLARSKQEGAQAQKELIEYRTKAQRILQEKENFIVQLKTGNCREAADDVQDAELQQITKERNLYCEEASHFSSQLASARQELANLGKELAEEQEVNREAINQLTEQLQVERERREELESDLSRMNEELRYTREDLTRAKTSNLTAIAEKEAELKKLRDHISFKQRKGNQNNDEEKRIQQLTESLLKKQSLLEAVNSEKNTMMYKIEHLERQLTEQSSNALRSRRYGLPFLEPSSDERRPSFLQESPFDGVAARQVKRAYTEIDKLSIRIGIALRRYPIARIFVLFYMIILHLWVFLVLFTYTPDTGIKMTTGAVESPHPQPVNR